MLNLFQNEWDALMLEMHQLRQALGTTRQELSYTLYMQDAATRVIARHGPPSSPILDLTVHSTGLLPETLPLRAVPASAARRV